MDGFVQTVLSKVLSWFFIKHGHHPTCQGAVGLIKVIYESQRQEVGCVFGNIYLVVMSVSNVGEELWANMSWQEPAGDQFPIARTIPICKVAL